MTYWARVRLSDDIVTEVIVAEAELIASLPATEEPAEWIECDYYTHGNLHYDPETNQPDDGTPLRGNYPAAGFIYDRINDVFYAPQTFPSWILNTTTWFWEAPTPCPGTNQIWFWEEYSQQWIEHPNPVSIDNNLGTT